MGTTHLSGFNIKLTSLDEGAAGDFSVEGIATDDVILSVVGVHLDLTAGTPNTVAMSAQNLTSEFTIKAAGTINNDGGTSLADSVAFCLWLDKDAA